MANEILIIDDDEDDCREFEESLVQLGGSARVEYRLSAEGGLQFLEEHKLDLPKVVVIDMAMPSMSGIKAMQKIIANYRINTIMYSTFCSDEIVKEVKALGCIDCMQKGTSYTDNLKFAKRVLDHLKALNSTNIEDPSNGRHEESV